MTQPRQPARLFAGALAATVVLTGMLTGVSQGVAPAAGGAVNRLVAHKIKDTRVAARQAEEGSDGIAADG